MKKVFSVKQKLQKSGILERAKCNELRLIVHGILFLWNAQEKYVFKGTIYYTIYSQSCHGFIAMRITQTLSNCDNKKQHDH